MELQKLEKYKQQFSYFSNTINAVQSYLNSYSSTGSRYISTGVIASTLSIPVLDVVFILGLAEKESLMKRTFHVYTENHDFLGKFESKEKIPDSLTNNNTGREVESENFLIDLLFEIEK